MTRESVRDPGQSSDRPATLDGALQGLRVVDLTTVVMGPYATAILSDLGADVIKVEPPEGDMNRGIGPARSAGMSAMALGLHRNKRSVVLDLRTAEGKTWFEELVRTADVIVTNLRPSSRVRMGITWEQLRALNPRVVFCTAQAYASTSTRRDSPAYDDIVQAASGLASLSKHVDGRPKFVPFVVADKVAGLAMVNGILAAILARHQTGRGQHVDIPMVDTLISFNLVEHLGGETFHPRNGDFGWARVLVPERAPHRTQDGWVCVMPYSDQNWLDFFQLIGRTELARDPRFADINLRHKNMGKLMDVIATVTPLRTTEEWIKLCSARSIPIAPVLDLENIADDEYVKEQGLVRRHEHPTEGVYHSCISMMRMSDTPVRFYRHAPRLGEHTQEVLAELSQTKRDDE